MDMDIPEVVLRAGEKTTQSFRFAKPSRLMNIVLSAPEGVKVSSVSFGGRTFELTDAREFQRYRILPTDDVTVTLANESGDDAVVSGTITLQDNPIPRQGAAPAPQPQGQVQQPPAQRTTPDGAKLSTNEVSLNLSRRQAELLFRMVNGEYVSPLERTTLIEPLRAATL